MTRMTTLAALLAAATGLSACMSNDAGMSNNSSLTNGVSNPDESATMGDTVSSPTDGIEDGPDDS